MLMVSRVSLALLALALVSLDAAAGQARQRLDNFYDNTRTLRADFSQEVRDANERVLQQAQGVFIMQRPNRFRWDYSKPFVQQIVADGKKLWIYDTDLEQITVKPLDTALGNTPALLLSGGKPLEQSFTVTEQADSDGLSWVLLAPKGKDTSFESIRLGFSATGIARMELQDNLGQRTLLSFRNLQTNPTLKDKMFEFKPPAGVDVIGAE